MKKIIVLLLLASSNLPMTVFAEWTKVGWSDDGEKTAYIDFQSLRKNGNKVKMWQLLDYKTVQIFPKDNTRHLSMLKRNEYDCSDETDRHLDMFWYSENMKEGEIVFSYPNMKIEPRAIIPGSIDETLFKRVCGKK